MASNITFSVVFYQQFGLDTNVVTKTVNMTTATINNLISNTTLTYTTGTYISTCGSLYNSPGIEQEKLILYIDLMAQLLGIDMNFQKFSEMSPEEIKSFTRDIKLNKIL